MKEFKMTDSFDDTYRIFVFDTDKIMIEVREGNPESIIASARLYKKDIPELIEFLQQFVEEE